jgi:starvation-inducible outer membrane lipoprotein
VREDGGDGIYVYQNGKVEALILGNSTVTGLGRVDGVSKGIGGVTGYHFAMSENGHIAFPAVVDGTECFVVAAPPATQAVNPPTAGN